MEEGITLVMSAAEYAARLQDIRTKLVSEYTVKLPDRFPGPYIDIRLYPRSKTESGVEAMATVFELVTQSPETLAEKLVFEIFCKEDPNIKGWTSAFTDVNETKTEAISATVEKLKEVVK